MPLSLPEFLCQMAASPALTLTVLLTLAVLLVNGWTDAPNAIAAAVVTGALPVRPAVGLAALCNLLGVLCVTAVNTSVAETIYSIASFGGGPRAALAALCAAMASIVLWAAAAWWRATASPTTVPAGRLPVRRSSGATMMCSPTAGRAGEGTTRSINWSC